MNYPTEPGNQAPRERQPSQALLLGANGFIGHAIRTAFSRDLSSIPLRLAARQTISSSVAKSEQILAPFDFLDRKKLRIAISGSQLVILAASYLGSDKKLSYRGNYLLAQMVAELCQELAVERLLYLSTTAVHGRGPFHQLTELEARYRPTSQRSADRARADSLILEAGGLVIRPHLVVGPGDRWVVPSLTGVLGRLGGIPKSGSTLVSAIQVEQLAKLIAGLAIAGAPGAYFAVPPQSVSILQLCQAIQQQLGIELPLRPVYKDWTRAGSRQLEMLLRDATFSSAKLADVVALGVDSPLTFSAQAVDWYRRYLSSNLR